MKRLLLLAALAIPASAYYHYVHYLSGDYQSGRAPAKFDLGALNSKTVTFVVSTTGPAAYSANDNFASVVNQIRQATKVWDGIASSDLRVEFGGFANPATLQNTPGGDVVFEDLGPGVYGIGSVTSSVIPVTPKDGTPFMPITRSTIHLNRNLTVLPGPSFNESFFLTAVHEMGHALGLQHTFTSSAMSTATTRATSLQNPVDADDIAGISVLYPNAAFGQFGSISGRITADGNGMHLTSVVALRAGVGAVSALTNPDGTYRIDGLPAGQYYVYAHALPPDADIRGPWDAAGNVVAPSGATNALFYPGATDTLNALSVKVVSGKDSGAIDIALAARANVPIYNVAVYGYFNDYTVATKPGYVNMLTPGTPVVVASGVGLGSGGKAPGLNVKFLPGSIAVPADGVRPYTDGTNTFIAFDVAYMLGALAGQQHVVITTPDYMYVAPGSVRLTQNEPPTVKAVTANANGTLTVTGTHWVTRSAIYFDGLPATILSLDLKANSAVVVPPPGIGGQTVVVHVYNPDGESSQIVQGATPVTFKYAAAAVSTIATIKPALLPAGAEAMVEITTSGFHFVSSPPAVGFGSTDIHVRRVFVIDDNHLQVNISIAGSAALANPDVSILSGFQSALQPAGFHVGAAVKGLPAPIPVLTNALPHLNGIYPGAIVALYGTNLAVEGITPQLAVGGRQAVILYAAPTQINFVIPDGLATGATLMTLNNGAQASYPVTIGIDSVPAAITGIKNFSGNSVGTSQPAHALDLLTISLSGFAGDGAEVDPARVRISVGEISQSPLSVTSVGAGVFEVSLLLSKEVAVGAAQDVVVYLDGRSSYPVSIPVANPDGTYTVLKGDIQ